MSLAGLSLPDIPTLTIPGLSGLGGVLNNVPGLGNFTSLLGGDTSTQPPIFTQLPKAQQALTTKYSDPSFATALQGMPPYIANAFTNYDQARVAKGQMPLTAPQTFGALKTAVTNTPATPAPHQNFLQNAVSDIGSLVSSIPKLPFNLVSEAEQLPQAPQKLSEALGAGSIPGILEGLAQVPGLRMVPGVNTLAELTNDPGQLLQHPVFTALDVLPYAAPAAGALTENLMSRLPSVQAARDASALAASTAAQTADVAELDKVSASRLANGLPPVPDQSALRIAMQQSPAVQALRQTGVGRMFANMFGTTARDLSQLTQAVPARAEAMWNGNTTIPAEPETQTLLNAKALVDKYGGEGPNQIPTPRLADLGNRMALDANSVLNDPTTTDLERGFVNEYIDHEAQLGGVGIARALGNSLVDGEIRPIADANRLNNLGARVQQYTDFSGARNLAAQASPATQDATLAAIDPTAFMSENYPRATQLGIAEAQAHAYEAAGMDSTPIFDALNAAKRDRTVPMTTVKSAFDQELANPTLRPATTYTANDISNQLAPYQGRVTAPGDPTVAQVRAHLDSGQYSDAVDKLRNIVNRSTYVIPNADDMLDSLTSIRDRQKFLDRTANFNDRRVAQLQRTQTALQAALPAARWLPNIEAGVRAGLEAKYYDDPTALALIHDHLYTQLPDLSEQELGKMYRDVAKTIPEMRANGLNPVFQHRVSPNAVPSIVRGSVDISDVLRTPDSVKRRTFDATPYQDNPLVSMSGEAMGYLRQSAAEEYVSTLRDLYGIPRSELEARYLPLARAANEARPELGVDAHLEDLIRRSHSPYDPTKYFGHPAAKLTTITGTGDMYIPNQVDSVLKQLFHDYNSNPISRLFDPIMRVYRTAIIPLSVRSLMHHMFGAAFQIAGESDPTFIFRQWQAGKKLVDDGEYQAITGMPPSGYGEAPAYMDEWGKKATKSDQVAAAHQIMGGTWIRKNIFDRLAPAKDAGGNVIDRISTIRQHMDDRLRAMAYLEGKQRALKIDPTLTEEQATQAGIGLVRKSMQNWDRMTPMERQTIRMILPFYGQMNQMLRYAFRYPMDHPFRVGVLDNFARNEVNDFGQALPSQLMDALYLGNPDPKTGVVNTLNMQQLNPFRDLPGYFTMAGFTGASNPVIQSVLRAVGVDPAKGAPSLYPDVAYDPATGQLRPDNPALLSSFLTNLIPQTEILTAMVGRNDIFKQVLNSNPDAAGAMLQSSLGLPVLTKNINPTVEATKAEVQRQTLQDQVKNDALRTGDWSKAQQFPGLAPFFTQLGQVLQQNPAALNAYQTQVQQGQQTPSSPALTPGAT